MSMKPRMLNFIEQTALFNSINWTVAYGNAANNTATQLESIFGVTKTQALAMEGMTALPGIDDRRQKNEITYLPDATTMLNFAKANGLNTLSIWAIQRDNGGCPGAVDNNTCSGIRATGGARTLCPASSSFRRVRSRCGCQTGMNGDEVAVAGGFGRDRVGLDRWLSGRRAERDRRALSRDRDQPAERGRGCLAL